MKKEFFVSVLISVITSITLAITAVGTLWIDGKKPPVPLIIIFGIIAVVSTGNLVLMRFNSSRYLARIKSDIVTEGIETLNNFPGAIVVIRDDGGIVWANFAFNEFIEGENVFNQRIQDICTINFSEFNYNVNVTVPVNDRIFSVTKKKISNKELSILRFDDITEQLTLADEYHRTRPVVLLFIIDSYEDLLQNAKETEKAQISVAIEQLLDDFIRGTGGILKKLSRDRFIVVMDRQFVDTVIEEKFSVLEKAHNITLSERTYITFSIGVGMGGNSYEENETIAKQSLDMALGRGGDQAAIKVENGYKFFGGQSQGTEKKSRSRARTITNALQELLQNAEKVYIMGHRFSDLDSIGSSIGLAGAIQLSEKKVKVVVDRKQSLANLLIENTLKNLDFKDLFIDVPYALERITPQTLLIIVDVHNKDILESKELYEKAKTVVVIDHHRKVVNYIDNAVIFHHEPFASSASEMVTEVIQYMDNVSRLPNCCADALLAGITLDTKNFVMRTGSRTFEAAAYLRKIGADTVEVKRLFSSSIESFRRRMQFVSKAEIHGKYAIAVISDTFDDIRLVAPQVADELLNVSGVEGSFVIFKMQESVNISARSLGTFNVQIIMEKLGGGGHQNMAAVQIKNVYIADVKSLLYKTLEI
ncbi:MAG: DHH family phosphoesterase [Oscillospiraceae bacterium]|nr:DHH family phosphoesterase [Oscillospiraceae bacterium]